MTENSGNGAKSEDRIAALEKKVNAIDALVKGLTQELLDLKPLRMKTSKVTIVKGVQVLDADPVCGTTPQQQGADSHRDEKNPCGGYRTTGRGGAGNGYDPTVRWDEES